jgi:hypothetical protein
MFWIERQHAHVRLLDNAFIDLPDAQEMHWHALIDPD